MAVCRSICWIRILPVNSPSDRSLTARLYWADLDNRIMQEMLLGIGGVRALRLLGYNPSVWHMNEGHAAFLTLERARELIQARPHLVRRGRQHEPEQHLHHAHAGPGRQ